MEYVVAVVALAALVYGVYRYRKSKAEAKGEGKVGRVERPGPEL